jgi:hypothetical protein
MPYRTNARVVEIVDDGEVDAIAREGRARRLRAALGVGALLTAGVLVVVLAQYPHWDHSRRVCHSVQLKYENAPEIPTQEWLSCRMVPDPETVRRAAARRR